MSLSVIADLIRRSGKNFKVLIVRRIFSSSIFTLQQLYASLYYLALGASKIEIGFLNSIGNAASSFINLPLGWTADRYSLKKVMILGLALEVVSFVLYFRAFRWEMIIPGIILWYIARSISMMVETVIVANSLGDEVRATGFGFLSSISTIPGLFLPLVAAMIVDYYGGISAEGIRPLYILFFMGSVFVFIYISKALEEIKARKTETKRSGFFQDFFVILKGKGDVKKMLLCRILDSLGFSIAMPFQMVYAVELKQATAQIIGYMGIASSIGVIIAATQVGVLADKIGRKRTMYLIKPIFYMSYLILILSPSPLFLIIAWGLNSIIWSTGVLWDTMVMEVVPEEQRGRWNSLILATMPIARITGPLLGSLLWERVNPSSLFLIHLAIDLGILMPLLATIRETRKNSIPALIP